MTDLFPGETRNRANYRGDRAEQIMRTTEPFGPDLYGAIYAPVSANYDPDADLTRVQFRPIPRPQPGAHQHQQPAIEDAGPMTRQQRRQLERLHRKQQKGRS